MSDFRITYVGSNYAVDATRELTGFTKNMDGDPDMTDWDKFNEFWDRWNKATEKEKENADNR